MNSTSLSLSTPNLRAYRVNVQELELKGLEARANWFRVQYCVLYDSLSS